MKDASRVTAASAQEYEQVGHADNNVQQTVRTRPIITIDEAPDDEEYEDSRSEIPQSAAANPNRTNGIQHHNKTDGTPRPRYAVMIKWNFGYFKTAVGFLRLTFMLGVTLSLVCLGSAGTHEKDVLDLEAKARIRLHVFCCILVLLVGVLICILEVTSVKDSLPYRWEYMDIFSTFILGILCIITSTLLLHALNMDPDVLNNVSNGDNDDNGNGSGNGNGDEDDENDTEMTGWSKALLAISAVFGYFGTLVSVFLIIFKCFANKDAKAYRRRQGEIQEEIMMVNTAKS